MEIRKALEQAEKLAEVEDILGGEGFLCSAYVMLGEDEEIEEWNLGFYSPDGDEITAVKVTKEGAEKGVTDKPLKEKRSRLNLDEVEVGAKSALERLKEEMDGQYSKPYKKILFSLKNEENRAWSATFVGSGLSIVSIDLDAGSGEVVKSEKRSIGGPSEGG